jgi:hypothetical protein
MLIANQISDTAFKFLMSDSKIATFFLETILEEEIVEVDLKPQELTYAKPDNPATLAASLAVFRLDLGLPLRRQTTTIKECLLRYKKHANTLTLRAFATTSVSTTKNEMK